MEQGNVFRVEEGQKAAWDFCLFSKQPSPLILDQIFVLFLNLLTFSSKAHLPHLGLYKWEDKKYEKFFSAISLLGSSEWVHSCNMLAGIWPMWITRLVQFMGSFSDDGFVMYPEDWVSMEWKDPFAFDVILPRVSSMWCLRTKEDMKQYQQVS